MSNRVCLLLTLITGFFIFCFTGFCEAGWVFVSYGIKEPYANSVFVDSQKGTVYAATDSFVYVSEDQGKNWKQIFSTSGKENKVNFISVILKDKPVILVATSEGLYLSVDSGEIWHKTYQKNVNCINCVKTGIIYIGTDEGVFASQDNAGTWQFASAGLGSVAIKYIEIDSAGNIYACAENRIFKSGDSAVTWKKLYSMVKNDAPEDVLYEEFPEETEESFRKINSLSADASDACKIYAATSKGVIFSGSEGENWSFMTEIGLDSSEVKHIIVVSGKPYIVTRKGVFEYDAKNSRWSQLYTGASLKDARFLSVDLKSSTIWVAAGNGVFKSEKTQDVSFGEDMKLPEYVIGKFNKEPAISEVQRAAIRYAEVHPDKIKNWRKEARIKALIPEFDLGYDKNISLSTTTNSFTVGPNDWSMDLRWNIGDIIFSDDQTNIDVRSRLMVELRDDILDDITRLYYERRRIQVDMLISYPKSEKEKYDKLLRIEELTASIDALTGGYFSARLGSV